MWTKAVIASIALGLTPLARGVAQGAAACARFADQIDRSQKAIAGNMAGTVADNSAPRATLAEVRIQNELQLIQLNLTLMTQAKCALPQRPFELGIYFSAALRCENDRMRATLAVVRGDTPKGSDAKSPESCKMETWKAEFTSDSTHGTPSQPPT